MVGGSNPFGRRDHRFTPETTISGDIYAFKREENLQPTLTRRLEIYGMKSVSLLPPFISHPIAVDHPHPEIWILGNEPARAGLDAGLVSNLDCSIQSSPIVVTWSHPDHVLDDISTLNPNVRWNVNGSRLLRLDCSFTSATEDSPQHETPIADVLVWYAGATKFLVHFRSGDDLLSRCQILHFRNFVRTRQSSAGVNPGSRTQASTDKERPAEDQDHDPSCLEVFHFGEVRNDCRTLS